MAESTLHTFKSHILLSLLILIILVSVPRRAEALVALPIPNTHRTRRMPKHAAESMYSSTAGNTRISKRRPSPQVRLPSTSSIHLRPLNLSASIRAQPTHDSVGCFENFSRQLALTSAEDCRVVVNHIILAYPQPMAPKSFGWNDGR